MAKRVVTFFAFCLFVVTLLTGCQAVNHELIPDANTDAVIAPVQVELARDSALEYVTSSACLADVPSDADWQTEDEVQAEGEYHFISGGWHMIVKSASSGEEKRWILIVNKLNNSVWYGYVKSDGAVITTSLMR